jgi:hypothetical protein
MNLYAYAGNDPVNLSDSSGLCSGMSLRYRMRTGTVTNEFGDTTRTSLAVIDGVDCPIDFTILDVAAPDLSALDQFRILPTMSENPYDAPVCAVGKQILSISAGPGAPGMMACVTPEERERYYEWQLTGVATVSTLRGAVAWWRWLSVDTRRAILVAAQRLVSQETGPSPPPPPMPQVPRPGQSVTQPPAIPPPIPPNTVLPR